MCPALNFSCVYRLYLCYNITMLWGLKNAGSPTFQTTLNVYTLHMMGGQIHLSNGHLKETKKIFHSISCWLSKYYKLYYIKNNIIRCLTWIEQNPVVSIWHSNYKWENNFKNCIFLYPQITDSGSLLWYGTPRKMSSFYL